MSLSTNMISGLASGIDWRTIVDQLSAIEHRPVDLVENRKSDLEKKLTEWQSFNTMLLALDTASQSLSEPDDFYLYTSSMTTDSSTINGEDLLSVSSSTTASTGSYTLKVTSLATAQKLSSNPFSSQTEELGSGYAGDIVINGKVLSIEASDSIADVAYNINGLNTGSDPSGVTATVVRYGTNDYRLILTSDQTGADGMSLLNGSSTNLIQKFGWKDNTALVIKNSITNGAQSDLFSNSNVTIKSLLGLTDGEASTGSLLIDGTAVSIDLAGDSITDIKEAVNLAMVAAGKGNDIVASVISESVDGNTFYRLQIEGTQSFADENNILNTLGVLDHSSANVTGKISGNSMTADGGYITSETLLADIDGYIAHTGGDNIQMTGNQTGGGAVNYTFSISSSTTVADLLSAIETRYATNSGDVVAYLTADGKIRVDDVAGGGSLSVTLTDNVSNGQLEFVAGNAAFGAAAARQREIVEGGDAVVEVDGVEVSRSSNTIDDILTGVTLNLIKADDATTVTLNIGHDLESIKDNIDSFVTAYNDVMTYINSQFDYDEDSKKTGGVLFGDGTLSSIKSDLASLLTENIWGVNSRFSILGLVGITMDNDLLLSTDDSKLNGSLETNFQDILSLFTGRGVTSSSNLSYISHTNDSQAGEYTVHINRSATQAQETGSVDLSAGGAAETLTITQGNSTATISITAGMTLEDIQNAINTEFDTKYAETLVGDQQLLEGGGAVTSQTKWVDVDGTTLANGDLISFSGKSRSGSSVSGAYTITDVGTDTIQGLLSAIETAYSNDLTATIDTSGRIVLTDKSNGYSQLSISIDEPLGKGLNFGTIDVTAGAGDGSQEGRHSMALTATHDGSNHLIIRSDDYGSTNFTISQDISDNNYNQIIYGEAVNTTAATDGAVYIGSTTVWSDVYGAGVTNGDTITISGKARDGVTDINGTYTVADKSMETVDGLLTAIENAYTAQGTTVNAFLRDGKIYIEDTTSGPSSISLALITNNEGGGSLDFGAVNQTTERDLDLGLVNGTAAGQDVVGTINGEAATGSGRVLTGDSGNANTAGLSVRYSGTGNDVDAGKIKLTVGVAELFKRTLFSITDSSDGYAAFKQTSMQDQIEGFKNQIEDIEARLQLKMEAMINRFVAMEMALSKIQNMSNWLAGQLSAAASAWR
jgi:flagellar hook-associated protein 2